MKLNKRKNSKKKMGLNWNELGKNGIKWSGLKKVMSYVNVYHLNVERDESRSAVLLQKFKLSF